MPSSFGFAGTLENSANPTSQVDDRLQKLDPVQHPLVAHPRPDASRLGVVEERLDVAVVREGFVARKHELDARRQPDQRVNDRKGQMARSD